jgi:hypothetical protein
VQVDLMISHLGQPYAAMHDTRPPANAYNQPVPDAQLAAQMQYIQRQQQASQQAQSHGHAVQGSGPPPGTYGMNMQNSGYSLSPCGHPRLLSAKVGSSDHILSLVAMLLFAAGAVSVLCMCNCCIAIFWNVTENNYLGWPVYPSASRSCVMVPFVK